MRALDVDGILDMASIELIAVPCVNYYVGMALTLDQISQCLTIDGVHMRLADFIVLESFQKLSLSTLLIQFITDSLPILALQIE